MIRAGTMRTVYAFSHTVQSRLPSVNRACFMQQMLPGKIPAIKKLNFYNINFSRTAVNSTVDNIHEQ